MRKATHIDPIKLEDLYSGILLLKNTGECRAFFRDLCTIGELQEFSKRFEAAQLIDDGVSYREIAAKTGVSTATITRIAQWLRHGEGGYRLILDRLKK